jgi:hypothetical protein
MADPIPEYVQMPEREHAWLKDAIDALVDALAGVAQPTPGEARIVIKVDTSDLRAMLATLRPVGEDPPSPKSRAHGSASMRVQVACAIAQHHRRDLLWEAVSEGRNWSVFAFDDDTLHKFDGEIGLDESADDLAATWLALVKADEAARVARRRGDVVVAARDPRNCLTCANARRDDAMLTCNVDDPAVYFWRDTNTPGGEMLENAANCPGYERAKSPPVE